MLVKKSVDIDFLTTQNIPEGKNGEINIKTEVFELSKIRVGRYGGFIFVTNTQR